MIPRWLFRTSQAARSAHSERLLRIVLGGLVLLAGMTKLFDRTAFFAGLMQFEWFDANVAWPLSLVIPVVESILGVWLIVGWRTPAAAVAGFVLVLAFTGVLASAVARGLEIECACFGPLPMGSSPVGWFVRNALFLCAFAWLFWRTRRMESFHAKT